MNEAEQNAFDKAQDDRMMGLAKQVMAKKAITPEENAEIIAWLILNFITMKNQLWTEDKMKKTVGELIDEKCKDRCSGDGTSWKSLVFTFGKSFFEVMKWLIIALVVALGGSKVIELMFK